MLFTFFWLLIIMTTFITSRDKIKQWQKFSLDVYKSIRFRHIAYAIIGIVGVITIATVLWNTGNKILQFGWLITPLMNSSDSVSDNIPEDGTMYTTAIIIVMIMAISVISGLLFLLSSIPQFAYNEEKSFRKPYLDQSLWEKFKSCVVFGLMHLIMGIPVAAAIALMFGGVVFMFVADREFGKRLQDDTTDIEINKESDIYRRYVQPYDTVQEIMNPYIENNQEMKHVYDVLDEVKASGTKMCQIADHREYAAQEAIMESTRVHAAYNAIIISLAITIYAVSVVSSIVSFF